ncbi:MAG: hypothetical protein CMF62_01090 [Magnetococcales bacterium]|nr:hypothetical protein [Magnetococcales bacterium]|tara:strand:+ start:51585 stop:52604 length:1020 start_codon:yes stop_codon:yes gene_type:complete
MNCLWVPRKENQNKSDNFEISNLDSPKPEKIKFRIIEREQNLSQNEDLEFGECYPVIKKLGSGAFAEVYLAEHIDGGYVALKMESTINSKNRPRLKDEFKIYRYLRYKKNFTKGLPKIYDFIETDGYNIMCMQLLGPSLEDMFKKYEKKLNDTTVIKLGIDLMNIMESLHNSGFIHRDIKPHNFMTSRQKNDDQVYIVDFGLSRKWRSRDGVHIPFKNKRSLIGTARYVSINMHNGVEPTRRDDLESIGYMLIYLLKGKLPWQGLKKKKDTTSFEIIGNKKKEVSIEELCEGLPKCFEQYMIYCRALDFDETPDYERLRKYFFNFVKDNKVNLTYQWLL